MNMVTFPVIDPSSSIDFYAGNDRSYRDLLPLWQALQDKQGKFYASRNVHENGVKLSRIKPNQNVEGFAPLVVSSYKDLHDVYANIDERSIIMFEAEYEKDFKGLLKIVSLFICKDERSVVARRSFSDNVLLVTDEQSAANYIVNFVKGVEPKIIDNVAGRSVGIIYVAFGEKAKQAAARSKMTLKRLGYDYPTIIIDEQVWEGVNPFDLRQRKNFQFRAGRVKPFLHSYTPFEFNLYIDADTKFLKPIHQGFEYLLDYDLVVTEEKLTLKELYNKKLAGWEINLLERDTTIVELNNEEERNFINSGVFFFRKNGRVENLFQCWHDEWLRFQEWDEQLALMRAINCVDLNIKYLPVEWNSPHLNTDAYIFHNYGRGEVRTNL